MESRDGIYIDEMGIILVYPTVIIHPFHLSEFPSAASASIDDAIGIALFCLLVHENISRM